MPGGSLGDPALLADAYGRESDASFQSFIEGSAAAAPAGSSITVTPISNAAAPSPPTFHALAPSGFGDASGVPPLVLKHPSS
jgi:hypothetical protein